MAIESNDTILYVDEKSHLVEVLLRYSLVILGKLISIGNILTHMIYNGTLRILTMMIGSTISREMQRHVELLDWCILEVYFKQFN